MQTKTRRRKAIMAILQQFEQDMDHLVTMAGTEGLFLRT